MLVAKLLGLGLLLAGPLVWLLLAGLLVWWLLTHGESAPRPGDRVRSVAVSLATAP